MLETTITLVGNLVDNPVHRTTPSGASVCTFRLASTPRRFDRSENRWVDGATLFLRVSCWRQLADNVQASLNRGDRALVYGRLRQRSFETSEGERRVSYEIDADAVGAELTWHAARSERLRGQSSQVSGAAEEPAQAHVLAGPGASTPHQAGFPTTGVPYPDVEGTANQVVERQPVPAMPIAVSVTGSGTLGASTPVGSPVTAGYAATAGIPGATDTPSPPPAVEPLTVPGATATATATAPRPVAELDDPAWRPFPGSDDLR